MGKSRLPMGKMSSVLNRNYGKLTCSNNYSLLSPTGPPSKLPSETEANRNPWFLNQGFLKRCFGTVFRRSYQYFSIALKLILFLSNRYKITYDSL